MGKVWAYLKCTFEIKMTMSRSITPISSIIPHLNPITTPYTVPNWEKLTLVYRNLLHKLSSSSHHHVDWNSVSPDPRSLSRIVENQSKATYQSWNGTKLWHWRSSSNRHPKGLSWYVSKLKAWFNVIQNSWKLKLGSSIWPRRPSDSSFLQFMISFRALKVIFTNYSICWSSTWSFKRRISKVDRFFGNSSSSSPDSS